jgi:hypothetical protein
VRIADTPPCGIFHWGAVAEYTDLTVVQGAYSGSTILVVHGCPELPRREYAEDGGTLESFRVGDYHLLQLTRRVPARGVLWGEVSPAAAEGPLYFCRAVDLYARCL